MGGGTFNVTSSAARAEVRRSTGATAFTRDADIRAGKERAEAHSTLDLTKKPRRESRDVPGKGPSTPIAMVLDVTGSMRKIPEYVINDAHRLMKVVLEVGEITDPQICTCAVGDAAKGDRVPIQVGEFEADDELFEAHLSNFFLEGGGGGGGQESYELMIQFFARQVDTDAWDKRRQKGILVFVGDEAPYPTIDRQLAERFLGSDPETDIPIEKASKELQERWHVFCIRPDGSSNFTEQWIQNAWEELLSPERVMKIRDWHSIVPLVAGLIPITNGVPLEKVTASLRDAGFEGDVLSEVVHALTRISAATPQVASTETDLPAHSGEESEVVRL